MNQKQIMQMLLAVSLIISSNTLWSQTISGTVSNEDGVPIAGATVLEIGTNNGVFSDSVGAYTLTLQGETPVIRFSYIGYTMQEIPVGNRTSLEVQMAPNLANLDEVVVVGYGSQRKGDLTGSMASAPLEAFEESPNTNILQALSGSTPGIDIGQVSAAGEEPNIQVRGQNSLNGNTSPLIILDGVYYRGRLSDLNPKDIASVNVLKDPSSKAIYGAQAANGVVIITTRNGTKTARKPVIRYSGFFATQTPSNELTPHDREGYLRGVRDADWINGYLAPTYTQENPDWTIDNSSSLFPPLIEGFQTGNDFDWYDAVTDPGYITDHQLSITGSTDKASYFVSGGYTDQKGWITNDEYQRVTGRVNLDITLNDWLSVGTNTFASFADFSGESPDWTQLPQMSPLVQPRDENGMLIINPLGDLRLNPFIQSASDDRDLRNNISGILYAKVNILPIKGLSYRINFSNNYRWDAFSNSSPFEAGQSGRALKIHRATYDQLLDNILTYNRTFGEDHAVNATFLYGMNQIRYDETVAEGSDISNLSLSYNSLQQAVIQQIASAAWEEDYLYQMARINYTFKDRYYLTATLRRDGFSGFSENNKFAMFPSVGLGWDLTKEDFLFDSKLVNYLKIRASYGENGNLTNRYSSLARVSANPNSQYLFSDGGSTVNGQQISSLANADLSWERTAGINVGVDFALLNNKVSGSIDYYQSTTTDLLWEFILPQISGFGSITSNLGEIRNNGLEFLINASPVSRDKFSWDLSVNFAANRNRIKSLLGLDLDEDGREDDLIANGLFIDESIGTVYDYVVEGIWQVGDEAEIPDGWEPGLYRLADLNGDGVITPEGDRRILGRTEPAYQFGIQNTLRYGDFTLKFFIKSIQGGSDGYLGENNPWAGSYNTLGNAQSSNWFSEIDYWSPSNPNAVFRRPGFSAAIPGRRFFARNFVRLQDISLSYTLNPESLGSIGLKSLKLFVSGKNLLTLTDWEGWDPETGQGLGATQGRALPVMRGITIGLDASL